MIKMEEIKKFKPLLVKLGVALALSFAGFLFSRFRIQKIKFKPSLPPPSSDTCSKTDSAKETTRPKGDPNATDAYAETSVPKISICRSVSSLSPSSKDQNSALDSSFKSPYVFKRLDNDEYEQEVNRLRNVVRVLRERERKLEVQLLEYYGLKDQESAVLELQNWLKISSMEAKLYTLKIESLQADNQRLEEQAADYNKTVIELENARTKIKMLKKKLNHESEQNKKQILNLQQRVTNLQNNKPAGVQIDPKRVEELESEVEELRKSTARLQRENSDLGHRLESTQILANSVLEDAETEILKEEQMQLRQENEDLSKEVEQLQADRCLDVEELIYLRWINACLRYEVRNYQPPSGKTVARDLSKSLSPKSEEKAKQLILEYAKHEGTEKGNNIPDFDSDQWSSSHTSLRTNSGDGDDFSIDFSSIARTNNSSSKTNFISKLKKLIRGKDGTHHKSQVEYSSDSPHDSSGISTGNDISGERQGHKSAYISPGSRSSLHLQRLSSLDEEDVKTIKTLRRNSDVGSNYKRDVSSMDSLGDVAHQTRDEYDSDFTMEKSKLQKYAEVFKNSRGANKSNLRRKSASYTSF